MKKFCCIFPGLYNYILTKDVGMIPYILSCHYNTKICTYANDDFTYMDELLKSENFSLEFLEDTGNEKNDVRRYIKENAQDIDILQLYHLRYNLLPYYIFTYRLYNRKGKIFLKLDSNNEYIDFLLKRKGLLPALRRYYVKFLFRFIDLVSIETKRNYDTLLEGKIINEDKLLYLPNGVLDTKTDLNHKEHSILYVGYVEKKNKSTDLLIEAFNSIDYKDWKLVLVGSIQDDMKDFLDEFFDENPHMTDKIILKGYVSDKKVLSEEYAKSSIYCCTSLKESFGISTLEAAYHGNYIISTDVGGSNDIIKQSNYGQIISHDKSKLEITLQHCINNWDDIRENPENIREKVNAEFNWKGLCEKIVEKIG